MNQAIAMAFKGVAAANLPPIDPKATYAYYDMETLIRHLTYIHQVQADIIMPCWLSKRHTNELKSATIGNASISITTSCNGFHDWEVMRILEVVSRDLSDDDKAKPLGAELAKLYTAPTALGQTEIDGLTAWNELLWQNIRKWASIDPLHEKWLRLCN
ncbi:MAG: hypothetical protein HC912_02180 [Saprospiraceae bacterium]|nr:hypothetical protein [Saprospiraceae bacterium]